MSKTIYFTYLDEVYSCVIDHKRSSLLTSSIRSTIECASSFVVGRPSKTAENSSLRPPDELRCLPIKGGKESAAALAACRGIGGGSDGGGVQIIGGGLRNRRLQ